MLKRFRCCECYKVQNSSLSQRVLSKIVAYGELSTHEESDSDILADGDLSDKDNLTHDT